MDRTSSGAPDGVGGGLNLTEGLIVDTLGSLGARSIYGGPEVIMAAEVSLLSRNVHVTGDAFDTLSDTGTLGMHIMAAFQGVLRVSYTRLDFCGQANILGRYCLHFHVLGHCPDCLAIGNAIEEGWNAGITIHGSHDILVDQNVLYNTRGAGIYIEDGNEINNTVSSNTITCHTAVECQSHRETGLYTIGMYNSFVDNRISNWQNTFFSPGGCCGGGYAWGSVCPQNTPFKKFKGQVTHDGARFGIYFDNQFSRNVSLDADSKLLNNDRTSCAEFTSSGSDNGFLTVIEDSLEYHQLFLGQYSLGDFQYKGLVTVNSGANMYW